MSNQFGSNDDQFAKVLAFLGMMRQAATPESQIHTQEQVDPKVRSTLPRHQALNLFLSWVGFIGGVWLFSLGIDWLLNLDWDIGSFLLAWIVVAILVLAAVSAARVWISKQLRVVQSFVIVLATLLLFLAVGSVLLSAHERDTTMRTWRMISMGMGTGLILASLAFGYNQALDLINPYWRQSPFERAMSDQLFPLFRHLLMPGEPEKEADIIDPRITYRRNGGTVARAVDPPRTSGTWEEADPLELEAQQAEWDAEIEAQDETEIDAHAGNLIWFVSFAAGCKSLSISDLTIRPAPVLPFLESGKEARLRRSMIQRLIARGSTEDVVDVNGHTERGLGERGWFRRMGQGATAVWARPVDEILADAHTMWEDVMGDMPFPDYWEGAEYVVLQQQAA